MKKGCHAGLGVARLSGGVTDAAHRRGHVNTRDRLSLQHVTLKSGEEVSRS
jgi:hypothetical protein